MNNKIGINCWQVRLISPTSDERKYEPFDMSRKISRKRTLVVYVDLCRNSTSALH